MSFALLTKLSFTWQIRKETLGYSRAVGFKGVLSDFEELSIFVAYWLPNSARVFLYRYATNIKSSLKSVSVPFSKPWFSLKPSWATINMISVFNHLEPSYPKEQRFVTVTFIGTQMSEWRHLTRTSWVVSRTVVYSAKITFFRHQNDIDSITVSHWPVRMRNWNCRPGCAMTRPACIQSV